MQIGKTIYEYRKACGLTQEALAFRLGVTTSAVSKWERDVSCPDIALLAPLARALDISLDTLLSFQADLTAEEIGARVRQADAIFRSDGFFEGFAYVRSQIETYPNCHALLWQLAVLLDAQQQKDGIADAADSDAFLLDCYNRVLLSTEESLRTNAADSLFFHHLRKGQFTLAERCLSFFSEQNPDRKLKQALLFHKTGRLAEANKACEEVLFSGCQLLSTTLQRLTQLAAESADTERMRMLTDKQQTLAKVFDMGKYHEVCCKLELAVMERDRDAVVNIMETMLASLESVAGFASSPLYRHMCFRPLQEDYLHTLKNDLRECFRDSAFHGLLHNDPRYQKFMAEQ